MSKNTASKIITYLGKEMTLREVSLETTLPLNQLMFKYEAGYRDQNLITKVAGNRALINGKYRSAAWMSAQVKGTVGQAGEFGLTPVPDHEPKGPRRHRACYSKTILTPSQVLEVFHLAYHRTYKQAHIAELYGIATKTVSGIKNGNRWGWLTAPYLFKLREETKK